MSDEAKLVSTVSELSTEGDELRLTLAFSLIASDGSKVTMQLPLHCTLAKPVNYCVEMDTARMLHVEGLEGIRARLISFANARNVIGPHTKVPDTFNG